MARHVLTLIRQSGRATPGYQRHREEAAVLELIAIATNGTPLCRHAVGDHRRILVGRSRDCDVVIPEPMVSRIHAEILCVDEAADRWVIRDLDSKHGLWARGQRVREAWIHAGAEVKLGPARLRFADLGARLGKEIDALIDDDPADSVLVGTTGFATAVDGAELAGRQISLADEPAGQEPGRTPPNDPATPDDRAHRSRRRVSLLGVTIAVPTLRKSEAA
jgi:predicted component of type VI protein secretion system